MYRIALCDDDERFLNRACALVRDWCTEASLHAETVTFLDGDSLVAAAAKKPFDLVFLDMIMPLTSGMDAARELRARSRDTRIVFLTSSPEFALESYEVHAADYLLKPLDHARLVSVLDDWRRTLCAQPRSIAVRTVSGHKLVFASEIEYLEARGKRCLLALADGSELESPDAFGILEPQVAAESGFFRCHRSYLVNLELIDHFNATGIYMRSGRLVPVARGSKKDFQEAYFARRFED